MSNYPNPYQQPTGQSKSRSRPPLKQNIPGIISLVIGVLAGLVMIVSIVVAAVHVVENGKAANGEPPAIIVIVGLAILLGMGANLLGGVLGIVGLFLPNTKKTMAIVGLVLNVLCFMGVFGLMLIGMVAG